MSDELNELRSDVESLQKIVFKLKNIFSAKCVFYEGIFNFDNVSKIDCCTEEISCYDRFKCVKCKGVNCTNKQFNCGLCYGSTPSLVMEFMMCYDSHKCSLRTLHKDVGPNKCECGTVECPRHRLYQYDYLHKPHITDKFLGTDKYLRSCSNCRLRMLEPPK